MRFVIEADSYEELIGACRKLAAKEEAEDYGVHAMAVYERSPEEIKAAQEAEKKEAAAPAATPAVPVSEPSYTVDDLARAGMQLMDSGKQDDLLALLGKFGVSALPELKKEQYAPFALALRELGASI